METCSRCGNTYPSKDGYFYQRKDGRYRSPCKDCVKRSSKRRHSENRDAINAKRRELLSQDESRRDKKRAIDAASYKKHREKRKKSRSEYLARPEIKERSSAYFKSLRDRPGFIEGKKRYLQQYHATRRCDPEIAEKNRLRFSEYWRANREKYLAHVRNRRARLRAAEGFHTAEDVQNKLQEQGYICYWCKCDISGGKHTVDHYVPIAKGGSNGPENLVMACGPCNYSKSDKMPDEFREYITRFKLYGGKQ